MSRRFLEEYAGACVPQALAVLTGLRPIPVAGILADVRRARGSKSLAHATPLTDALAVLDAAGLEVEPWDPTTGRRFPPPPASPEIMARAREQVRREMAEGRELPPPPAARTVDWWLRQHPHRWDPWLLAILTDAGEQHALAARARRIVAGGEQHYHRPLEAAYRVTEPTGA